MVITPLIHLVPRDTTILISVTCYIHVAIQYSNQDNIERWASVVDIDLLDQ